MTEMFSSRASRWLGEKVTCKRNVAIALVHGSILTTLIVCASAGSAHANSNPFTISPRSDGAPAAHITSLLALPKRSAIQSFMSRFDCPPVSPIMNIRANALSLQDITGSVPVLRLDLAPPKPVSPANPVFLASLTPPATVDAHSEGSGGTAPEMIVGIASTYNPDNPDDNEDAGEQETASGELYDAEGWTAAIRIDLRDRFGGVHYGKNYQPAYALVEAGNKRAIIKVNDVGPLMPGRIIDLNQRAMRYFDPTLQLGLVHDMRVTPLPGPYWTAGPIGGDGETMQMAGGFAP
jgi:peptidoglycan lytic transglycosylase